MRPVPQTVAKHLAEFGRCQALILWMFAAYWHEAGEVNCSQAASRQSSKVTTWGHNGSRYTDLEHKSNNLLTVERTVPINIPLSKQLLCMVQCRVLHACIYTALGILCEAATSASVGSTDIMQVGQVSVNVLITAMVVILAFSSSVSIVYSQLLPCSWCIAALWHGSTASRARYNT